ncbi:hypothetical protein ANANG_G00253580, partial [Anguilla anguilla]
GCGRSAPGGFYQRVVDPRTRFSVANPGCSRKRPLSSIADCSASLSSATFGEEVSGVEGPGCCARGYLPEKRVPGPGGDGVPFIPRVLLHVPGGREGAVLVEEVQVGAHAETVGPALSPARAAWTAAQVRRAGHGGPAVARPSQPEVCGGGREEPEFTERGVRLDTVINHSGTLSETHMYQRSIFRCIAHICKHTLAKAHTHTFTHTHTHSHTHRHTQTHTYGSTERHERKRPRGMSCVVAAVTPHDLRRIASLSQQVFFYGDGEGNAVRWYQALVPGRANQSLETADQGPEEGGCTQEVNWGAA